jgi:hypothetical protein
LFSWEFIPEENASKPTVGRSSGVCHDDFTTVGEAEPYVGKHVPKGDVSQRSQALRLLRASELIIFC